MRTVVWGLVIAGLMAMPAMGTVLVGNNPDVNNGGLVSFSNNQPTVWVKTGSNQQGIDNNDRLGSDGKDMRVGNDWPGAYEQWYTQEFPMAAGNYDIHVEGWTKVWSGGWTGDPYEMEAHVVLLVDGAPVWTSPNAVWDAWRLQSHDAVNVSVNSSVGVQLHAKAATGTEPWAHARFDDIVLSVVPEPASLGLLLLGLPLLRRRR